MVLNQPLRVRKLTPRDSATAPAAAASGPHVRERLIGGKKLDFHLRHDVAMVEITISLGDALMVEIAQMARHENTTEADLVRQGIEPLIHPRLTGPEIPRFARRLGPLAISESHVEP